MRVSEFWSLLEGELGEGYAPTFARGHVLHELSDRTVVEALEAGVKPRVVWLAVCEDLRVPAERRLGKDHAMEVPRSVLDSIEE